MMHHWTLRRLFYTLIDFPLLYVALWLVSYVARVAGIVLVAVVAVLIVTILAWFAASTKLAAVLIGTVLFVAMLLGWGLILGIIPEERVSSVAASLGRALRARAAASGFPPPPSSEHPTLPPQKTEPRTIDPEGW